LRKALGFVAQHIYLIVAIIIRQGVGWLMDEPIYL